MTTHDAQTPRSRTRSHGGSSRPTIRDIARAAGLSVATVSRVTHDDPRVTGAPRAHRQLLKSTLESLGFVNLAEEWWHYTYQPEPYPDTYFDFPVSRAALPGTR